MLPAQGGLSTAEVYRQADRLGPVRTAQELARLSAPACGASSSCGAPLPRDPQLLHNDLQARGHLAVPADRPGPAQGRARREPRRSFVSGSGPTVVGLFSRANAPGRVGRAVAELAGLKPAPIAASSVGAAFAAAVELAGPETDGAPA